MNKRLDWLRIAGIILAYILTFAGILVVLPLLFSLSKSWLVGFLLFVIVVPVFPAMQTILSGQRPASLLVFFKIYVAEYASLVVQLIFLLVTVPFIAIAVFGRLTIALLVTAVIGWFIVGLQQLGVKIGRQLPKDEIVLFFWVTLGLAVVVGSYYWLSKLAKKYEDGFFNFWAEQFVRIRDFFRY